MVIYQYFTLLYMNLYIHFMIYFEFLNSFSIFAEKYNHMDKRYKENSLDPERWALIDKQSGSVEEFKNKMINEVIPTNQVSVHYKHYFLLDTDRLEVLLTNGVKDIELGVLLVISSNLHSAFNICRKPDDTPHNTKSISKIFGQTEQATKKKLNRLIKHGVLAHTIIPNQKNLGKVYIVNPYLIKRSKYMDEYMNRLFFDIVKSDNEQLAQIKQFENKLQDEKSTD